MRFTLIDRITALDPGKSLEAVKSLSLAEEYLADHFPGFPVMPGVLMLEALTQAGAWLLRVTDDFAFSTILLKEAKAVKFVNFVRPGRTLHVSVQVHEQKGDLCVFKGSGTVDGTNAVSARITLQKFNLADRSADLVESDQLRIQKARELLTEIWPDRPARVVI